jgi:hypothetical protein
MPLPAGVAGVRLRGGRRSVGRGWLQAGAGAAQTACLNAVQLLLMGLVVVARVLTLWLLLLLLMMMVMVSVLLTVLVFDEVLEVVVHLSTHAHGLTEA